MEKRNFKGNFIMLSQLIDEHWQHTLNDELNRTDENFGINDYIKCLEIITRNNLLFISSIYT
jgi:hypothetical protein